MEGIVDKRLDPGDKSCSQAHNGLVLSGEMTVREADGREVIVEPGDAFEVGAGHDAWVAGDEPCIALDFECLAEH